MEQRVVEMVRERIAPANPEGCWLWLGNIPDSGYGRLRAGGRNYSAHRLTYEMYVGEIPRGLVLDHLCRNRACVNPEHLEPVTQAENIRRGLWGDKWKALAARTHCPNGHEFTPENTRTREIDGARICRACRREWDRKNRKSRAASARSTT